MAIDIAAQACLPLLHWGEPRKALRWYDDFVTIVLHPGEAVARRQVVDEAGVVHEQAQVLLGEAMERGPIMLSWAHASNGRENTERGHNVVVHEFVHKLDMKSGEANGCPPLPAGRPARSVSPAQSPPGVNAASPARTWRARATSAAIAARSASGPSKVASPRRRSITLTMSQRR